MLALLFFALFYRFALAAAVVDCSLYSGTSAQVSTAQSLQDAVSCNVSNIEIMNSIEVDNTISILQKEVTIFGSWNFTLSSQCPRMFDISSSTVSISGISFYGRRASLSSALYVDNANLTLFATIFSNFSHYAIDSMQSTLSITSTHFHNNEVGAPYSVVNSHASNMTLLSSHFFSNRASAGGAMSLLDHSHVIVSLSTFSHNTASDILSGGGAIYTRDSRLSLENCQFVANNAAGEGGALDVINTQLTLIGTIFDKNSAQYGGAIAAASSRINADNVTLTNNAARQTEIGFSAEGGALSLVQSYFTATQWTCRNNHADGNGGCIYSILSDVVCSHCELYNCSAGGAGGGIAAYGEVASNGHMNLDHITATHNIATAAGAILAQYMEICILYSHLERNAALASNGGALILNQVSLAVMMHMTFLNNTALLGNGGAIHGGISYVDMLNVTFASNAVGNSMFGGAIYFEENTILHLNSSTWVSNKAGYGTGIYIKSYCTLNLQECEFSDSVAVFSAAVVIDTLSSSYVRHSRFIKNIGKTSTGAFLCKSRSECEIEDSSFTNNVGIVSAGAIESDLNSMVSILRCEFVANSAVMSGGSFYIASNSKLAISDSVISNGVANSKGGAIALVSYSFASLNNVSFTNNSASIGGAIHAEFFSSVFMNKCSFIDNDAINLGGAIFGSSYVGISANKTRFLNNHAIYGGCIYMLVRCTVYLQDTYAHHNSADLQGGFLVAVGVVSVRSDRGEFHHHRAAYGGVFRAGADGTNLRMSNNSFVSNIADVEGGALYLVDNSMLFTDNSVYDKNIAYEGAGIFASHATVTISSCVMTANIADDTGGALASIASDVTITSSSFSMNKALFDAGGAIYARSISTISIVDSSFSLHSAGANGGVIFSSKDSSLELLSSTLENNVAVKNGGGVYMDKRGSLSVVTSIFRDNSATSGADIYGGDDGELTIEGSHFSDSVVSNDAKGGSMHIFDPTSISLLNCDFTGTRGGWGTAVQILASDNDHEDAYVLIYNTSFVDNGLRDNARSVNSCLLNSMNGGALSISHIDTALINECVFNDNVACYGGGIYSSYSTVYVTNSQFIKNTAVVGGGGMYWSHDPNVEDHTIVVENTTDSGNRAMYGKFIATSYVYLQLEYTGAYENSGYDFESLVVISHKDFYGQTIISDNSSVVIASSLNTNGMYSSVSGSTIVRAVNGVATFRDFRVTAEVGGQAAILFLSGTKYTTRIFYFRRCIVGEVFTIVGTAMVNGTLKEQSVCSKCTSGYYSLRLKDKNCEVCPKNAHCPGGAVIDVDNGYWRSDNVSDVILECTVTKLACNGGTSPSSQCSEGNTGAYCSVCEDGYRHEVDGKCSKCEPVNLSPLDLSLLILVPAAFIAIVVAIYCNRAYLRVKFESIVNKYEELTESEGSKIKILFAFIQILAQFPTVMNLPEIPVFSTLLRFCGVFSFSIFSNFSLECIFKTNFYQQLLISTLLPIFVTPLIFAFYYIRSFLSRQMNAANPMHTSEDARLGFSYWFLVLLFATFSPASTTVLQTFACEKFDDGKSYLSADYSVSCDTEVYQRYVLYAAFMVIVYPIGIPLFYLYLLRINITGVNPPSDWVVKKEEKHIVSVAVLQLEKIKLRQDNPKIKHIRFLYESYKPNSWYFELVECFRRLSLSAIPSLILRGTVVQTIIVLLFSLCFTAIYAEVKPFTLDSDSYIALVSQWGVSITLILSIILRVADNENEPLSSTGKVLTGLSIVAVNISVIICTIFVTMYNSDSKAVSALSTFKKGSSFKRKSNSLAETTSAIGKKASPRNSNPEVLFDNSTVSPITSIVDDDDIRSSDKRRRPLSNKFVTTKGVNIELSSVKSKLKATIARGRNDDSDDDDDEVTVTSSMHF